MYFPDITAEHANQAAFLYDTRRRIENSWIVDGSGLARFDHRIVAHLSGILGDLATEQDNLLERAACGDSGAIYCSCAAWLLSSQSWPAELKHAVAATATGFRAAAAALQTLTPAQATLQAKQWLAESDEVYLGAAVATCHALEIDPGQALAHALGSERPALREVALDCAGSLRRREAELAAGEALDAELPAMRFQGARWFALTGAAEARDFLEACLEEPSCTWQALRLLASLLPGRECTELAARLARSAATRRQAARLAGYSGLVQIIESLLQQMEDPLVAPFAAEAMGFITDLDYARQGLVATAGSYDHQEPYTDEGFNLPQPDADAIGGWWEENAHDYPLADEEWLMGERRSSLRIREILTAGNEHARSYCGLLLAQQSPDDPLISLTGFSAHLPVW